MISLDKLQQFVWDYDGLKETGGLTNYSEFCTGNQYVCGNDECFHCFVAKRVKLDRLKKEDVAQ